MHQKRFLGVQSNQETKDFVHEWRNEYIGLVRSPSFPDLQPRLISFDPKFILQSPLSHSSVNFSATRSWSSSPSSTVWTQFKNLLCCSSSSILWTCSNFHYCMSYLDNLSYSTVSDSFLSRSPWRLFPEVKFCRF